MALAFSAGHAEREQTTPAKSSPDSKPTADRNPPSRQADPMLFGAKGDGISDDTLPVQKAFNLCSTTGMTCRIPRDKSFLVKAPLYLWGHASVQGEDKTGKTGAIVFNAPHISYLLNIGISGPHKSQALFTGKVSDVTFKIAGGEGGRIIYFWRTDGARIVDNIFDAGAYDYSATSSGNDERWFSHRVASCVRKNILIKGNVITARAENAGSEGIGLVDFDEALIENNRIVGVGDDPIGIHYCRNVRILHNDLKSGHGRIFVSNSRNVEIADNRHERMKPAPDSKYRGGIALIYIGFETFGENEYAAPTNTWIHHNTLILPEESQDQGGVIYVYAPRDMTVEYNHVINNSTATKATGFRLLPANFSGRWGDPDHLDPPDVARVWNVSVRGNVMEGQHPLPMGMTGNCVDYKGTVLVTDNSAPEFGFYCENVKLRRNSR